MTRAIALVLALCVVATGCTSLQRIRLPDQELHAAIRDGSVVVPGDRIEVIYADGTKYVLEVYSMDDQALRGKTTGGPDVEVPIDQIATIKVEKFSVVRTVSLAPLVTITAIGTLVLLLLIPK